jgi:hypothetical protein
VKKTLLLLFRIILFGAGCEVQPIDPVYAPVRRVNIDSYPIYIPPICSVYKTETIYQPYPVYIPSPVLKTGRSHRCSKHIYSSKSGYSHSQYKQSKNGSK